MVERPNDLEHTITIGEARKMALANPKVARISRILFKAGSLGLKSKVVNKIMNGEGYQGWRALNMLIFSRDIEAFDDHLSGSVDELNPNHYPDIAKPLEDENFYRRAGGECLLDNTGNAFTILELLAEHQRISAKELEEINVNEFSRWIPTFALSRARWARDTENGLELTQEGLEAAIDFGIAKGHENESKRRELGRTVLNKIRDGEEELLKLKSEIYRFATDQAKAAIIDENPTPDSLEEIAPLNLRDLLVYQSLQYQYSSLTKLDQINDARKHHFEKIKAIEGVAFFTTPEEFESKLEELGRQKYQQIQEDNGSRSTTDDQLETVESIYEGLKFPWKIPGPRDLNALQTIQQLLKIPFWQEDWQFPRGLNYAYKSQHTKESRDEEKITVGSMVNINAKNKNKNEFLLDSYEENEWEVMAFRQGMFSTFYPHYQFVHLKDSQNWLYYCYLANVRLAK